MMDDEIGLEPESDDGDNGVGDGDAAADPADASAQASDDEVEEIIALVAAADAADANDDGFPAPPYNLGTILSWARDFTDAYYLCFLLDTNGVAADCSDRNWKVTLGGVYLGRIWAVDGSFFRGYCECKEHRRILRYKKDTGKAVWGGCQLSLDWKSHPGIQNYRRIEAAVCKWLLAGSAIEHDEHKRLATALVSNHRLGNGLYV